MTDQPQVAPRVAGPDAAVPGLCVVVAWWSVAPPESALVSLAATTGAVPLVQRVAPARISLPHGQEVVPGLALLHRRARRRLRRAGLATARSLAPRRGGSRPARAALWLTREPTPRIDTRRGEALLAPVLPPANEPLLVVVTDTHSAQVAWDLVGRRPGCAVVLGTEAAERLVVAVAASTAPWWDWQDVAADSDYNHVYAALPRPTGAAPLLPHVVAAGEPGAPVQVPPPPPPDAETRIVVGPANYAGQGAAWTVSLGSDLGVAAENVMVARADTPYLYPADHPVTADEWRLPSVRARLATDAVACATHVVLESMRPVLDVHGGARSAWDFAAGGHDARAVVASGRRLAVLLHGSESRSPDLHAERYPHSPFAAAPDSLTVTRLRGATAAVHRELDTLPDDVLRLVSTPDMLDFVPGSRWLPVVVGREAFEPGPRLLDRRLPVVLHAPSNPVMKGSDVVDRVLGALHEAGLIEYRRLEGVHPALVADHVRAADLVVDQVSLGNLGVMALEAMAAGRLVLAHALPEVLARYEEDVPLVLVDPTSLAERVRTAVADVDGSRETAARAVDFVRRHHDGRRTAEVMGGFVATWA